MFNWRQYFGMFVVKGKVPGRDLDYVLKRLFMSIIQGSSLQENLLSEDWNVSVLKSWMEKF